MCKMVLGEHLTATWDQADLVKLGTSFIEQIELSKQAKENEK